MLKRLVASRTEAGQRQLNQDNLWISEDERVFVVCDGMGAGEAGSIRVPMKF
jgi:serine/threonine protein phosphatase PrpC